MRHGAWGDDEEEEDDLPGDLGTVGEDSEVVVGLGDEESETLGGVAGSASGDSVF